jgi:phospholipid/cholesterol/gamma-HCH transport system substrate-binding protein
MESDKHYFLEGLFVIAFALGIAFFFLWVDRSGNKDDVLYRIHFAESVSGLALGDPVKFMGVDVGLVKAMAIDPDDPHTVRVDVALRNGTPVKTDTKATLKLKGITGTIFIELDGGSADSQSLVAATPAGQVPEIPSQKSTLNQVMDQLPQVVTKFSAIEDKADKAVNNIDAVTKQVKQNPSVLLWGPKKKDSK